MGNSISTRNVQTLQNNGEGNPQPPLERDIVTNGNLLPIENQQPFTCSSPTLQETNLNGINCDKHLDGGLQTESFSKDQRIENGQKDLGKLKYVSKSSLSADLFNKEILIVINDCYNGKIKNMVNGTAQHPKTRNPTKSPAATNSNNSAGSSRDHSDNEHITNETIMTMTTKSPLSTVTPVPEVIMFLFVTPN